MAKSAAADTPLLSALAMYRTEREDSLWRAGVCRALSTRQIRDERPLLRKHAPTIAACLCVQYVHGMAGQARC